MRKLFLIPIVCSLLLAGCGGDKREPQASSAPGVELSANPSTEAGVMDPSPSNPDPASTASSQPVESTTPADGSEAGGIVPVEIDIPDIGVDASVISLGLTEDGAMDVPSNEDDVGWFKPGYRPGVPGHAVVAGHVDSKTGPAVFYKLKTLKKGSKIIVRSKKGEERVFRVVGSESYPYDDAPLKEIFGPADKPLLNLITCTGLYSRSKGTHQERLVVTAELDPPAAA
jgi:sortase A